jgi:hypothetical protein
VASASAGRRPTVLAAEVRGAAVYLRALRTFLAGTVREEDALAAIRRGQAARERSFLTLLAGSVFANPRSPYRALCAHAGIELGDVERLVRDAGVEGALEHLFDAGVRVTSDELRGRVPIRRGSLELAVRRDDFNNPLAGRHYDGRSGGSRSGGARVPVNLALVAYEAGYLALVQRAFGVTGWPAVLWLPAPPGAAGLKSALMYAKLGRPLERWFSTTDPGWRGPSLRYALHTQATVLASRLFGGPRALPAPEHVPASDADRVARWAAAAKRRGSPGVVGTGPSAAARVCRAARELGLDISGTLFRGGGEPHTPARAELVGAAGARMASSYFMGELGGMVGLACAAPEAVDEVHVATDKVAVVQRERRVGATAVGTLVFTTLQPLVPRLALNLDSDDFGVLGRRDCGCAVERAGLRLHLHGIRSYLKLTSEGMNFLGEDVVTLVERVLPARFGGSAGDYQLVEHEEESGLPVVAIVVAPGVGEVRGTEVVEAVLSFLDARGDAMMAEVWRGGRTLRVLRREPYVTGDYKLPVVHRLGTGASADYFSAA